MPQKEQSHVSKNNPKEEQSLTLEALEHVNGGYGKYCYSTYGSSRTANFSSKSSANASWILLDE